MDKDFEFVRKHAKDANPKFIQSLLSSYNGNPNKLETVMCEILQVPNAQKLIREFRNKSVTIGEKRVGGDIDLETHMDNKKVKASSHDLLYYAKIHDIFPDVDELFLKKECKLMKDLKDCSRFINTVMICGLYPKKEIIDLSLDNGFTSASSSTVNSWDVKNEKKKIKKVSFEEEISRLNFSISNDQIKIKNNDSFICESSYEPDSLSNSTEIIDVEDSNDSKTYDILNGGNVEILNDLNVNQTEEDSNTESTLNDDENSSGKSDSTGENDDSLMMEEEEEEESNFECSQIEPVPSTSSCQFSSNAIEIMEIDSNDESKTLSDSNNEENSGNDVPEVEDLDDVTKITEESLNEQLANLVKIFPKTDPSYLRQKILKLNNSPEEINAFVISKLERNDMPTREDYEKKLEMEDLQNRYTKNFSISHFLKVVPDPWTYFKSSNRNCAKYKAHSLCYLKTFFKNHYVRDLIHAFHENNFNLYLSCKSLIKNKGRLRKARRSNIECVSTRPTTIDIQFLQEVSSSLNFTHTHTHYYYYYLC